MMSAASTLRKVRMKLCLEPIEIAQKLNISRTSYYNYESGYRRPGLRVIRQIMEMARENNIDVTIEDFLDENDKE